MTWRSLEVLLGLYENLYEKEISLPREVILITHGLISAIRHRLHTLFNSRNTCCDAFPLHLQNKTILHHKIFNMSSLPQHLGNHLLNRHIVPKSIFVLRRR